MEVVEASNIFKNTIVGNLGIAKTLGIAENKTLLSALSSGAKASLSGFANSKEGYSGWDTVEDFAIGTLAGRVSNDLDVPKGSSFAAKM